MSFLDKIDSHMPLAFYASVNSQLTEPEMVALAERLNQPRLLDCSVPLTGAAELVISDPAAITLILNWLKSSKQWCAKIEETLQGLVQDKEGRSLLPAFMPIADLVMLGRYPHHFLSLLFCGTALVGVQLGGIFQIINEALNHRIDLRRLAPVLT